MDRELRNRQLPVVLLETKEQPVKKLVAGILARQVPRIHRVGESALGSRMSRGPRRMRELQVLSSRSLKHQVEDQKNRAQSNSHQQMLRRRRIIIQLVALVKMKVKATHRVPQQVVTWLE